MLYLLVLVKLHPWATASRLKYLNSSCVGLTLRFSWHLNSTELPFLMVNLVHTTIYGADVVPPAHIMKMKNMLRGNCNNQANGRCLHNSLLCRSAIASIIIVRYLLNEEIENLKSSWKMYLCRVQCPQFASTIYIYDNNGIKSMDHVTQNMSTSIDVNLIFAQTRVHPHMASQGIFQDVRTA